MPTTSQQYQAIDVGGLNVTEQRKGKHVYVGAVALALVSVGVIFITVSPVQFSGLYATTSIRQPTSTARSRSEVAFRPATNQLSASVPDFRSAPIPTRRGGPSQAVEGEALEATAAPAPSGAAQEPTSVDEKDSTGSGFYFASSVTALLSAGAAYAYSRFARQSTRPEEQAPLALMTVSAVPQTRAEISEQNPLHIIVAGAGVGGLALAALVRKKPHIKVTVLERTSEFKRFGGPIQLASNAMQIIKSADPDLYEEIEGMSTCTGNRVNGIKDGIRTDWYAKFDLGGPVERMDLPYTCVVDRPDLQNIFLERVGENVRNAAAVKSYEHTEEGVTAILEDGSELKGDVLIGADGIWSNIRATMHENPARGDESGATYSGYTVFAGELSYGSPDNGEVGYKVYIGPKQYFVITDIGKGRYQWYAFLGRKPDSANWEERPDGNVKFIKTCFEGWSDEIHAILNVTKDEEVEQRDLYDRRPAVRKPWTDSRVALMGDAIHAMMPNLGQGGCQAIEDALVIAEEMEKLESRDTKHVDDALRKYRNRRLVRSAAVQGLSRFASDIIINGFDTPAKVVWEQGKLPRFENFNYNGVVTAFMRPILPVFFTVQFNFLYSGWRNNTSIDPNGVKILALGSAILALTVGSAVTLEGEAGLIGAGAIETLVSGEGMEALIAGIRELFSTGI